MTHGGARPGAGRKKGYSAIQSEKAREILIQAYIENIEPINEALINKAKDGDIQAIKELHDRVYGKAMQPIEGDIKAELNIVIPKAVAESFGIDEPNK